MSFVHLHVHSEYSLLDGAARIDKLVNRAKSLGQDALAITDHGVMYGAINFYKACKKAGIRPIIGCEVYVAPRSRFDRVHDLDTGARHLVLLCRNETGYRNLCALVSKSFTEGFYIKPRIDLSLLAEHSDGLIALSACLAGEIPRTLLDHDYEAAKEHALYMQSLFGKDGYYIEIQDHGIPEQKQILSQLTRLSQDTGIPLVATNDSHYITREDAQVHDVLLCIQTGKTIDDPNRMKFESEEFYLKSEEEMLALFPSNPEAIENTQKIAELCEVDFTFGQYHLPEFKLPAGWTSGLSYFIHLCEKGFEERYPTPPADYKTRLKSEMDMITNMGFVDYFLIVSDFIAFAKSKDIPVGPGRGSAAGSMVSYCLGITDVDPMKYALYFERFLNPERISMPDIDIDFCYKRRSEVIDYVIEKYGEDHVAQIVTFGTMAAKGSIRDVARVLNIPYAEADSISKLVPTTLHMTLEHALKISPQLRETYEEKPEVHKVIDTAMQLEGMPRHASTHAAGVVITKQPVSHYVPLAKNDESIVTQYPMTTLEELGLLKMDFLGLRNLTVLNDAVTILQETNPNFTLGNIPEHDTETFGMLSQGHTSGVFQMESAGMTSVCKNLKPKDIEDITAIIALYRPGPMESIPRFIACKQNPALISYKHPSLEPILSITYGCIVYQEQVIEIFRQLAKFSLGQADMVRRAISKKKAEEIQKERNAFIYGDEARGIAGCVAGGIDPSVGEAIYDEIYDFANYAFNKAHAVSYAILAYQTAWFKCHHPKEYMAALLTSILDSQDKVREYISECLSINIKLLPPDINESGTDFTVSGNAIRFGLSALKGVGRQFTNAVLNERKHHGKFTSFHDFCERMLSIDLNKRVLESLIRCGAFDQMGHTRAQLLDSYESLLDGISRTRKKNLEGQVDLFGNFDSNEQTEEIVFKDIPEFPKHELLAMEKEITGLYLSGHPMDTYRTKAKQYGAIALASILNDATENEGQRRFQDNQTVTIAGVVAGVKTKNTKNDSLMAYIQLEDDTGELELIAFSRTLQESGSFIKTNSAILLQGRISIRDEKQPQVICNRITPMDTLPEKKKVESDTLYLRLPSKDSSQFEKMSSLLSLFPGSEPVVLYLADSKKRLAAKAQFHETLLKELRNLLGEESVVIR